MHALAGLYANSRAREHFDVSAGLLVNDARSLWFDEWMVVANRWESLADQDGAHGVGFLGVHEGRDANFVFVDWWAGENELRHHVYRSSTQNPAQLEYVSGVGGGVWDLQLVWFERNAWVEKVLANPRGPDLDAYLNKRLSDQA